MRYIVDVTTYPISFLKFGYHDNNRCVNIPHHPPEIGYGVRHRALCCYKARRLLVIALKRNQIKTTVIYHILYNIIKHFESYKVTIKLNTFHLCTHLCATKTHSTHTHTSMRFFKLRVSKCC